MHGIVERLFYGVLGHQGESELTGQRSGDGRLPGSRRTCDKNQIQDPIIQ